VFLILRAQLTGIVLVTHFAVYEFVSSPLS
jgi:hypothetical protein